MTGPGALVITASGSITAPATITPTVSAAVTSLLLSRIGRVNTIAFPSLRAIALCNGIDFQMHFLDAGEYLTGPIAPYTAPTPASTAVKATATLVTGNGATTDLANNDRMTLGNAVGSYTIVFATTLTPGATVWQVKRGTSLANTVSNLEKMINNTGTDGTEYTVQTLFGTKLPGDAWAQAGIECTGTTGTTTKTTTFRATTAGVGGNGYAIAEITDSGATWSVTAWTGGATGTGTAPLAGYYLYGYSQVRKADSMITGLSNQASIEQSSDCNISVGTFDTAPTRDAIDFRRLWRTLTDGSEFHMVHDSASDPVTDDLSDTTIDADGNPVYDPNAVRPYAGGYPTRYRYHAENHGCVFGAGAYGHAKHGTGTASVTNASRSVTLSAGAVKQAWIGRTFRNTGDEQRYRIVEVVEATRVLTLSEPYRGTTAGTAPYEVSDDRDPFLIYYCEPLLLNAWPVENELSGVSSSDPTGITGLRSMWDSLIVWTRTGVWRVLGNPRDGVPRVSPQAEGHGCYCNRAVINVGDDGGTLLWLGADGIRAWDGSGNPRNVSNTTDANGDPVGIDATLLRINPLAVDGIVGNYNPSLKVARWAVPVDGSLWNNLIVQLNLQSGTFTTQNCDAVTSFASLVGPAGTYVTVAGDMYGNLWQMDNGYSDGAYGFETVQTLTVYDSATNTITVGGTPFPTATGGLAGVPVILVASDGTRQRVTIGSNTSSTLKLTNPPDTAPAVSSQIVVGGIFWRMLTTKYSLGTPDQRKTLSSLTLHFTKSTAGQVWFAAAADDADPTCYTLLTGASDYADLTATKGTKYFEMRRGPGRTIQIELFALAPGFDLSVIALAATYRVRDQVPA